MLHLIDKKEKGKFVIQWENDPKSLIELDFNPVINAYGLENAFVLTHWQAIPKGKRRWGMYCNISDTYYSCDSEKVFFGRNIYSIQLLQIPELEYPDTRPTAVVMFQGAKVQEIHGTYLVS